MSRNNIPLSVALTKHELINEVEKIVRKDKLTHIEAICLICKERELEVENIINILDDAMKKKIFSTAVDRNLIKAMRPSNTNTLFG